MRLSRGDIILTNMPCNPINPTQFMGIHFYLLVSEVNQHYKLQAVPLTSKKLESIEKGQVTIQFQCLKSKSKVLGNELSLFHQSLFLNGKYCGKATETEMEQVNNCIKEQLGLCA